MPGTLDTERPPAALEDELEELKQEEHQLEERTGRIELSNGLATVLSISALMVSVVAVAVAFIASDNGGTGGNGGTSASSVARSSATAGPAAPTSMGSGAQGGMGAAAPGTVNVTLGEMWVRPSTNSVPAGKVTFVARNMGNVTHELMVERMPIKLSAPGQPVESATQGMVPDMRPGQSGKVTLRLKPGKYELFCNVPGHYAAGQHTVFTVTA